MRLQLPKEGFLCNRLALLAALGFCIYQALPPSMTGLEGARLAHVSRDPISILGEVAAALICAAIVWRSPFLADRVVFGVGICSLVLEPAAWLVRQHTALYPLLRVTDAALWVMAAAVCFVYLAFASRA